MARRKLAHFAEMAQMPRVWENPEGTAGTWRNMLQNKSANPNASDGLASGTEPNPVPLVLELGCGTGLWTIGMAQHHPEVLWLGSDIKGARMWHGAKLLQSLGLHNAGFLRTRLENLEQYFAPNEVNEIWLTFPDPQPRESREKKRLSSPAFLRRYRRILTSGGSIHLKTDNLALFRYSLEAWQDSGLHVERCLSDLHHPSQMALWEPEERQALSVCTTYESRYKALGVPIHYLRASYA